MKPPNIFRSCAPRGPCGQCWPTLKGATAPSWRSLDHWWGRFSKANKQLVRWLFQAHHWWLGRLISLLNQDWLSAFPQARVTLLWPWNEKNYVKPMVKSMLRKLVEPVDASDPMIISQDLGNWHTHNMRVCDVLRSYSSEQATGFTGWCALPRSLREQIPPCLTSTWMCTWGYSYNWDITIVSSPIR